MKRTIVALVALAVFAGPVMADLSSPSLVVEGLPSEGGSWSQEFLLTDPDGSFDRVLIGLVSPASQRPWSVSDLSSTDPGTLTVAPNGGSSYWSIAAISSDQNIDNLYFTMNFAEGDPLAGPGAVSFVLTAFDDKGCWKSFEGIALADNANGTFEGWDIRDCSVNLEAVPLPGAVLLGVLGLVAARRKLHKVG